MAKGQMRSNREAKKPKGGNKKPAATVAAAEARSAQTTQSIALKNPK